MSPKLNKISCLLFFTILICHSALGQVTRNILFFNITNRPVQQTQTPYLDNFSYYSSDADYQFIAPNTTILPNTTSTASISYDWWRTWYNIGQFAYNYSGRSANYGCFVTTISLSGHAYAERSYHIVISSYRKDPSNSNDYLICRVKRGSVNTFIVNFTSSQDWNEKNDNLLDDSNRYTIQGDDGELKNTSKYRINKPIPLNPNLSQPALVLYPDERYPALIRRHYVSPLPSNPPGHTDEISITNYASVGVVSGPSPLLDKYSQFNSQYFFEMPASISPGETVKVKIGIGNGDFDLERFSYQIAGYAPNSGCYITTSTLHWATDIPIASFYFDPLHPEKNLYCLATDRNTISIYDDPELKQLKDRGCKENDLRNCISTYNHFYKDGDTLDGMNFKYHKLPVGPDDSMHYLKLSPGTMNPALYYMPTIPPV